MHLYITVKTSAIFICCILCSGFIHGQKEKSIKVETSKKALKGASKFQDTKTLLWEVSGNGLQQPSYIFGTMHILCATDAQLSPNLKNIIKETGQIYFEIDMDNIQEIMGAMKYLQMNDGKKISDLLSEEDYQKVKDYFDKNKSLMPFSMMNRFKPYFVSSLIGERMMDCEKTNGMEQQIMTEAKQYRKEIRGLETIEFQASIFDSIPYEQQAKELVTYIDSIDSYRKVMAELVEVYRKQDLDKMEALMIKTDPGIEGYMDLLLYGRNRRWIDLIQNNMNEKQTLFAVGAGHLPGKQGILQLLKNKGFTVKPVKNS